jgi:hypothetical protein
MTKLPQKFDPSQWRVLAPRSFIDKRVRLTRESGLVHQNVRAYRGEIVRKGDDGKAQNAHCNHAHNKPGVARKCAEREARKRNRALARGVPDGVPGGYYGQEGSDV